MKTLTVFTPTYNRSYTLPRLYDSLCRQTSNDFLWLIVDDGSSDDTSQLVEGWKGENKIEIFYYRQENGGKMRAHNKGVQLSKTKLFVCVDSDDYLANIAVEKILFTWNEYYQKENIAGVIGYKEIKKNGVSNILSSFPSILTSTLSGLYAKGFVGDTTLVFRTDVIKQFPFPEINGEKFITESYVYEQIDQSYVYVLLNEPLTICEYQEEGYSYNIIKVHYKNPKGMALYYNQHSLLTKKGLIDSLRSVVYYIIYSRLAKENNIYAKSKRKGLIYLLAWGLSFYYQKILIKQVNE